MSAPLLRLLASPSSRACRTSPNKTAGIDEVGRGPLAGPVLAAVVLFPRCPSRRLTALIDDSKRLTTEQRQQAYDALRASGAKIGVGAASVAEIASLNILNAALLAMRRAVARLPTVPDLALVDGNRAPDLPCPVQCVVGGDGTVLSIAAASIVAKVVRDRAMARLAQRFPGYGWERNAGYGTAEHREAIHRLGPTPHHRIAFGTVRLVLASRSAPGVLSVEGQEA